MKNRVENMDNFKTHYFSLLKAINMRFKVIKTSYINYVDIIFQIKNYGYKLFFFYELNLFNYQNQFYKSLSLKMNLFFQKFDIYNPK